MVYQNFLALIKNKQVLLSDGATGTNLIARGLPVGLTTESWVLDNPDQIIQLHDDFIANGADIILTSTFSATSIRLKNTPLAGKTDYINRKAVELARSAIQGRNVFVAGSLGPVGQLMKPYGPLDSNEVTAAYQEQARALSEAGADLLVIETHFDLGEVKAAIQGIRSVSDLPLVASLSYDRGKRTMMGVSPTQSAKELDGLPIDLIGINCGHSLDENLQNLLELRQVTTRPIWFKPNAGLPRIDPSGKTLYDVTPVQMGLQAPSWLEAGAQVIGGCCGTSPEHLGEISRRVKTR